MAQAVEQSTIPEAATLPEPSAELILWRIQALALVDVLGRKKAERYLRKMAETMATEASFAEVIAIRSKPDGHKVRQARREAASYFERMLPALLAGVR